MARWISTPPSRSHAPTSDRRPLASGRRYGCRSPWGLRVRSASALGRWTHGSARGGGRGRPPARAGRETVCACGPVYRYMDAYTALAPAYDAMTASYDYERWLREIEEVLAGLHR